MTMTRGSTTSPVVGRCPLIGCRLIDEALSSQTEPHAPYFSKFLPCEANPCAALCAFVEAFGFRRHTARDRRVSYERRLEDGLPASRYRARAATLRAALQIPRFLFPPPLSLSRFLVRDTIVQLSCAQPWRATLRSNRDAVVQLLCAQPWCATLRSSPCGARAPLHLHFGHSAGAVVTQLVLFGR